MLLKYIRCGLDAHRLFKASALFDEKYYARTYHVPAFLSIWYDIVFGHRRGNNPSEEFSAQRYYEMYPAIRANGWPALYHYLKYGEREGRIYENVSPEVARCPLLQMFDGAWYARTYMTATDRKEYSALQHYLQCGWQQGNLPCREFDMERFTRENPNCAEEPLHYCYRKRLPAFYVMDLSYLLFVDPGNRAARSLSYFSRYVQDAALPEALPRTEHGALEVFFAPTPFNSSAGMLLAFQEYYLRPSEMGLPRLAVTPPGQDTVTGESVFDERLRVFRYEQLLVRMSEFDRLELYMTQGQAAAFAEYLQHNPTTALSFVPQRTLHLLNTDPDQPTGLLRSKLLRFFSAVEEEAFLLREPGDGDLFGFFDAKWYRRTYLAGDGVSAAAQRMDPKDHYLSYGWRHRLLPFAYFDIDRFYADHPDCSEEPLFYCERHRLGEYYFTQRAIPQMKFEGAAGVSLQSLYKYRQDAQLEPLLPFDNNCEKVLLLMVSPEDAISGGIMSFYGIYHISQQLTQLHGRTVIAVSIPGDTTQAGFTMFRNDMPVFRYDAVIQRLHHVKDLLLMVPEIYVEYYVKYLRTHTEDPVLHTQKVHFNILNQKIEVMPEPDVLDELRCYFSDITQTVAHYKYCTQKERDYYGLPMHLLLPPIIKEFHTVPYEQKEEIFAYSYDDQPWKAKLLALLAREFPALRFVEIKGLMFDEYLELIHRAKWCMTFGEGLDGYFSEPYQSGGISFAVWNDDYFTERYHHLPTVLDSVDDALARLPQIMRALDNKEAYESTSALVRGVHGEEYAGKRTSKDQLTDFFNGKYDFP